MKRHLLLVVLLLAGAALHAQSVEVKDAWVRATVPGQKASGAFMTLTAKDGATLVGVSSPSADFAEIHFMKLENGTMTMRAVDALDLPAGQVVALQPGGYHVMLLDLKAALRPAATVPLTLSLRDRHGVVRKLQVRASVRLAAPAGSAAGH